MIPYCLFVVQASDNDDELSELSGLEDMDAEAKWTGAAG